MPHAGCYAEKFIWLYPLYCKNSNIYQQTLSLLTGSTKREVIVNLKNVHAVKPSLNLREHKYLEINTE